MTDNDDDDPFALAPEIEEFLKSLPPPTVDEIVKKLKELPDQRLALLSISQCLTIAVFDGDVDRVLKYAIINSRYWGVMPSASIQYELMSMWANLSKQ